MAKIILKQHGKIVSETDLTEDQEFIAGRSSDADIILDKIKGISRHHLKFYFSEGIWIAELMSRFGQLICEGEPVEAVELQDGVTLSVPPYDFTFEAPTAEAEGEPPSDDQNATESPAESDRPEEPERPVANHMVPTSPHPNMPAQWQGNMEATSPGAAEYTVYLRIRIPDKKVDDVLQLEGNIWTAGRDPSCEVTLDDYHVSRKHFEISQTREGFFITDLGSANGTALNGEEIPANEPRSLTSGDVISIMTVQVTFEVHDANYEDKIQDIPAGNWPVHVPQAGPFAPGPAPHMGPASPYGAGPAVVKVEDEPPQNLSERIKRFDFKKNKVRVFGGTFAVILIIIAVLKEDGADKTKDTDLGSKSPQTFEALSEEQKAAVIDKYSLAKNLYVEGKYELCISELDQLHEVIPHYDDSKDLAAFCRQGSELLRQHQDKERRERERQRVEQQIVTIVNDCRAKLDNSMTLEKIQQCLAPAIELDPEHPEITGLVLEIEEIQRKKEEQKEAAQQRRRRVAAGNRQYKKAMKYYHDKSWTYAIRELKEYLNGHYPDPRGYRSKAKRSLASAQKSLDDLVSEMVQKCKTKLEQKAYKESILACEEVLKFTPGNDDAKSMASQARNELNLKMKDLYQDSILEESLGNVDAAKEKWKQITDQDIKGADYYNKAEQKLEKYGIEVQ